ncbi:MAG: hypothetical protein ACRDQB_10305 [Thermocrispum sp.]
MPPKPPQGRTRALASVRVPRAVIAGIVVWFLVAFAIIVPLMRFGVREQLGIAGPVAIGLVAAVGVLVPDTSATPRAAIGSSEAAELGSIQRS